MTNINHELYATLQRQTLSLNDMLVWSAWTGPQSQLASSNWLGHLCSSTSKKISGMEVRRAPEEMTDQSLYHLF